MFKTTFWSESTNAIIDIEKPLKWTEKFVTSLTRLYLSLTSKSAENASTIFLTSFTNLKYQIKSTTVYYS